MTRFVIFGITGDLATRKLLPSLYNLERGGHLKKDLRIIGVARKNATKKEFEKKLHSSISKKFNNCNRKYLVKLIKRIQLVDTAIGDIDSYSDLHKNLLSDKSGKIATIYYFALPPNLLETTILELAKLKLNQKKYNNRLLIEKPFGSNLNSARKLLYTIQKHFHENDIYRIDHYLAKTYVQNILYFREHNPIFRELWNNKHISNIQISSLEQIDIQGRVNFYEQTGALRDMIQGHLLQLMAVTMMDESSSTDANLISKNRNKIIDSIKSTKEFNNSDVYRSQYSGYTEEVGKSSLVETFVALRLEVNTPRWSGVPIYLRAGKALSEKVTEVNVVFKSSMTHEDTNVLTFRIKPNKGIALRMVSIESDIDHGSKVITLDHCENYNENSIVDSYEKIIFDAINGDKTLFPSANEIIESWKVIDPIKKLFNSIPTIDIYPKNSVIDNNINSLVQRDNNSWINHDNWVCRI